MLRWSRPRWWISIYLGGVDSGDIELSGRVFSDWAEPSRLPRPSRYESFPGNHGTLVTISTESLFVVNWVNSGGIVLGLLVLGVLAQNGGSAGTGGW